VLTAKPSKIDPQFLQQFPEFQAFLAKTKATASPAEKPNGSTSSALPTNTPEEQIEAASLALNASLRDALLARILEASPASFERLIIALLLRMGYGGSSADAGEHLGHSGDGGLMV